MTHLFIIGRWYNMYAFAYTYIHTCCWDFQHFNGSVAVHTCQSMAGQPSVHVQSGRNVALCKPKGKMKSIMITVMLPLPLPFIHRRMTQIIHQGHDFNLIRTQESKERGSVFKSTGVKLYAKRAVRINGSELDCSQEIQQALHHSGRVII